MRTRQLSLWSSVVSPSYRRAGRATLRELAEDLGHLRERIKQLQRTAESALRIRMQLPLLANRQAG
jgi:DNA-directed RNA polymerase sigma subunit (sigma70/sigma32)